MLEKRIAIRPRLLAANLFLWRPMLYACGLLLFLAFDEQDTKFIYFQFQRNSPGAPPAFQRHILAVIAAGELKSSA
jgi:hypothetical protein